MSMTVHAFHCSNRQFTACDHAPVRNVLAPCVESPGFVIGQRCVLRVGADVGPYEICIDGWDGRTDVVGGVTVFQADHDVRLWESLLRLSAKARMVVMGDALGAIGCLAATQKIADEIPIDTLNDFGQPVVTTDAEVALAAIEGKRIG